MYLIHKPVQNKFVKFLLEKARDNFLEDHPSLYKNYIKLSTLKDYITQVTFMILRELSEEGSFYEAMRISDRLSKIKSIIEVNNEIKVPQFESLLNEKIFKSIDNDEISLVIIFVDSLKNTFSSHNFKNLLKTCYNSALVNSFVIIKFVNNEKIWKIKIHNISRNKKTLTIINIKCNGNYNYSIFISTVLKIVNKYPFKNKEKKFLAIIDDDCKILNTTQNNNHFDNLILELMCGKKLISGECIDERKNISHFHSFANFPYVKETVILYEVPYSRGGGGATLVNLRHIPPGIPNSILPGIYLNNYFFNKLSIYEILKIKKTRRCEFIGTSKKNLVVHHTKDSLLSWSITRIKYKDSWNKAYSLFDSSRMRIYKHIKQFYLQEMIQNLLKYSTIDRNLLFRCVGYVLVTFYYKKYLIRHSLNDFIKKFIKGFSDI